MWGEMHKLVTITQVAVAAVALMAVVALAGGVAMVALVGVWVGGGGVVLARVAACGFLLLQPWSRSCWWC